MVLFWSAGSCGFLVFSVHLLLLHVLYTDRIIIVPLYTDQVSGTFRSVHLKGACALPGLSWYLVKYKTRIRAGRGVMNTN